MTTDWKAESFRLLMISAMYENGGNTTHRLLDGHPALHVYPFESQLGTRLVLDHLTSMFPVKYRWPVFDLDASPAQQFRSIIDEETRVRARTPFVSKFREHPFNLDDHEREAIFVRRMEGRRISRAALVAAFFESTFDAWKDEAKSGEEVAYVGYSPIVGVDAERILQDLPNGHLLHVVRNPWSAYADTKKRAVPLSLVHYVTAWSLLQHLALAARERFPDRLHIVRFEDIVEDPLPPLGKVLAAMGIGADAALAGPSWNRRPLDEVYPWGTIRSPTAEANRATADELSREEKAEIRRLSGSLLNAFSYS